MELLLELKDKLDTRVSLLHWGFKFESELVKVEHQSASFKKKEADLQHRWRAVLKIK